MNEPCRLMESGADDFERELLRSSRDDAPGRDAMARTLLSLGVTVSVPLAAAGAAQGAVVSGKVGAVVLSKWLFTGVVLGFATVGGARLTERAWHEAHERPRPTTSESVKHAIPPEERAAAPRRDARVSVSPTAPPKPAPSGGDPVPPGGQRNAEAAASGAPPARSFGPLATLDGDDALKREVNLLDAAQNALSRRDANAALGVLRSYESEFRGGVLGPEARVLKVRALFAAGQTADASALAQSIILSEPGSEHADAVRVLLARDRNR